MVAFESSGTDEAEWERIWSVGRPRGTLCLDHVSVGAGGTWLWLWRTYFAERSRRARQAFALRSKASLIPECTGSAREFISSGRVQRAVEAFRTSSSDVRLAAVAVASSWTCRALVLRRQEIERGKRSGLALIVLWMLCSERAVMTQCAFLRPLRIATYTIPACESLWTDAAVCRGFNVCFVRESTGRARELAGVCRTRRAVVARVTRVDGEYESSLIAYRASKAVSACIRSH